MSEVGVPRVSREATKSTAVSRTSSGKSELQPAGPRLLWKRASLGPVQMQQSLALVLNKGMDQDSANTSTVGVANSVVSGVGMMDDDAPALKDKLIEGNLWKQPHRFGPWHRRYYVLSVQDRALLYYREPGQIFPSGYVPIDDIRLAEHLNVKKKYFDMHTTHRLWHLHASSAAEAADWVAAINAVVAQRPDLLLISPHASVPSFQQEPLTPPFIAEQWKRADTQPTPEGPTFLQQSFFRLVPSLMRFGNAKAVPFSQRTEKDIVRLLLTLAIEAITDAHLVVVNALPAFDTLSPRERGISDSTVNTELRDLSFSGMKLPVGVPPLMLHQARGPAPSSVSTTSGAATPKGVPPPLPEWFSPRKSAEGEAMKASQDTSEVTAAKVVSTRRSKERPKTSTRELRPASAERVPLLLGNNSDGIDERPQSSNLDEAEPRFTRGKPKTKPAKDSGKALTQVLHRHRVGESHGRSDAWPRNSHRVAPAPASVATKAPSSASAKLLSSSRPHTALSRTRRTKELPLTDEVVSTTSSRASSAVSRAKSAARTKARTGTPQKTLKGDGRGKLHSATLKMSAKKTAPRQFESQSDDETSVSVPHSHTSAPRHGKKGKAAVAMVPSPTATPTATPSVAPADPPELDELSPPTPPLSLSHGRSPPAEDGQGRPTPASSNDTESDTGKQPLISRALTFSASNTSIPPPPPPLSELPPPPPLLLPAEPVEESTKNSQHRPRSSSPPNRTSREGSKELEKSVLLLPVEERHDASVSQRSVGDAEFNVHAQRPKLLGGDSRGSVFSHSAGRRAFYSGEQRVHVRGATTISNTVSTTEIKQLLDALDSSQRVKLVVIHWLVMGSGLEAVATLFRSTDIAQRALALRLLFVLAHIKSRVPALIMNSSGKERVQLASRIFADFVRQACGGGNCTVITSNCLMALMVTPLTDLNDGRISTERFEAFRLRIINPGVWQALLTSLENSEFHTRRNVLKDINAFLIHSPFNCDSLLEISNWRELLLSLLADIPAALPSKVLEGIYHYVLNIFTLLHHHLFMAAGPSGNEFLPELLRSINLPRMGFKQDGETVTRGILAAFVSKLTATKYIFPNSFASPLWDRLLDFLKSLRLFLFGPKSANHLANKFGPQQARLDEQRSRIQPFETSTTIVFSSSNISLNSMSSQGQRFLVSFMDPAGSLLSFLPRKSEQRRHGNLHGPHWQWDNMKESIERDIQLIDSVISLVEALNIGKNHSHDVVAFLTVDEQVLVDHLLEQSSFFYDAIAFLSILSSRYDYLEPPELLTVVYKLISGSESDRKKAFSELDSYLFAKAEGKKGTEVEETKGSLSNDPPSSILLSEGSKSEPFREFKQMGFLLRTASSSNMAVGSEATQERLDEPVAALPVDSDLRGDAEGDLNRLMVVSTHPRKKRHAVCSCAFPEFLK